MILDILSDMFKRTIDLTDTDKRMISEMTGKIMLWVLEGRSISYMAKQLNLTQSEVIENVFESSYLLREKIGIRTYLKMLLHKRR